MRSSFFESDVIEMTKICPCHPITIRVYLLKCDVRNDAVEMESLEIKLLSTLGIDNPYQEV